MRQKDTPTKAERRMEGDGKGGREMGREWDGDGEGGRERWEGL